MQRYVDGFVLPVLNDNVDEYREMAAEAGEMWIESRPAYQTDVGTGG